MTSIILQAGPPQWPPLEWVDYVVKELNFVEAPKSSIFVVQKAAAPKNGVELG